MRIETERLLLRPMDAGDLDAFVELHVPAEVVRFFGAYGREQAAGRLRTDARQWRERGYGLFALIDRSTGRFVGRVGLRHWAEWEEVDVGWVLHPEHWGRGLATEAAGACVQWAFRTLGLPSLIALIEPGNVRSVAVARRLGMVPVRHEFVFERDMIVHAVTRDVAGSMSLPVTGYTPAGSGASGTAKRAGYYVP